MSVLGNGTLANLTVPYYGSGGGGGSVSTFATASISSLSVSSINGEAQWFSSFTSGLSIPAQTSTAVLQIPGNGAFNYNIQSLSTAQAWVNAGMGTQAFVNPAYFGALGADIPSGAATPSPLVPYLSTPLTSGPIWLGVSNPTAGAITLAGASVASSAA
jgi:hypothetical protein